MKRYQVAYTLNGTTHISAVNARDAKSAKAKILQKYNISPKQIKFEGVCVVGYY